MPHAGELLSMLGTLRGEGPVAKVDNSLLIYDAGDPVLRDQLGNPLLDKLAAVLTE